MDPEIVAVLLNTSGTTSKPKTLAQPQSAPPCSTGRISTSIRPSMWEMGQRLADMGYAVLLPDLYYRHGNYAQMVPSEVFSDPKKREKLMEMVGSLDRDKLHLNDFTATNQFSVRGTETCRADTVLLVNGKSAKPYGHDIVKLYAEVKRFAGPLLPDRLQKPADLDIRHWFERTGEAFIEHLLRNGNADNR